MKRKAPKSEIKDIVKKISNCIAIKCESCDFYSRYLLMLFGEFAKEIITTPIREGDRKSNDEIIEDGAREALLREVQKEKLRELLKSYEKDK